MLVLDQLYFSDPREFNDPLDTKPCLKTDLSSEALQQIVAQMAELRVSAEMKANAQAIGYRGPKTVDHIARRARRLVTDTVDELRYQAGDPELAYADPLRSILGRAVQEELLRQYDRGIFSLAERPNCPLMWSHYGDQHKGVCIGYSVPADAAKNLHKIKYGSSRFVSARDVAAMLAGDLVARRRVDAAVLLSKASEWQYEREWRLVADRGPQSSRLELREVVFGLRCETAVRYAIIMALKGRRKSVKFYEIRERDGTFDLKKTPYDSAELLATFPRRARDIFDGFRPVVVKPKTKKSVR